MCAVASGSWVARFPSVACYVTRPAPGAPGDRRRRRLMLVLLRSTRWGRRWRSRAPRARAHRRRPLRETGQPGRRRAVVLFTIVLAALVPTGVEAATIRVPADVPTIQGAIVSAHEGDTILVAPGIYVENLDFLGRSITVTSEQGPQVTVID